jgi:hypothetical protein
MVEPVRDFVSVDMRGMKAALVARARERGVAVSAVVRTAIARDLGLGQASSPPDQTDQLGRDELAPRGVKVSIRLSAAEALQLTELARGAALSRNAYIGGLIGGATVLRTRADHVAAVTASCAELATLSRNLHHLATLLRLGSVRAALEYAGMLDSLQGEVRRHLQTSARALAYLRGPSASASRPAGTSGRVAHD